MLLLCNEDRNKIIENLDNIRAAARMIPRILREEIAAHNTIDAGLADSMIILANLPPATEAIRAMVEMVFEARCPRACDGKPAA